jgi:pimeloyl-ACP methyl ester carboxylesterase
MDFEGFEEKYLQTQNGRLFYLHRSAPGKTIIFLHGIGGSLKSWNKLTPYLPHNLNIYLIDMLGHGRSDAPEMEYDVMVQVDALDEFIQKLALDTPVLFGHSYGGWMAIHYSLRQKVDCLIIEDCAGMESQQLEINSAGKKEEDRKSLIIESIKIGANEKVITSAANNFDKHMLTDAMLQNVSARTLLIWGADDEWVPIKFGNEMHSMIKDSEFLSIPEAGHVPHRTKPQVVGDAIAKFY